MGYTGAPKVSGRTDIIIYYTMGNKCSGLNMGIHNVINVTGICNTLTMVRGNKCCGQFGNYLLPSLPVSVIYMYHCMNQGLTIS